MSPTGSTPDFERFLHEWDGGSSTKLAIGFDYDEDLVDAFRGLDWNRTHATYEPEYTFMNGREKAHAVGTGLQELSQVRDATGLNIPDPSDCPVNRDPFGTRESRIKIKTYEEHELTYECMLCENDGILSAFEFRRVFRPVPWSDFGVQVDILLDDSSDATHYCTSCERLFEIKPSDGSMMARAMGGGN